MLKKRKIIWITLFMALLLLPQLTKAAPPIERQCCRISPGDAKSFPATTAPPLITLAGPPVNVIIDGSFENGSPNSDWNEASTNFGSPLCTIASCGTGTGTGPNTGDWWAWFGGISAYEEGSLSQTVTIPSSSTAILTFQFENIVCADPSDFLEVRVDGNQEWIVYASNPLCGVLGYSPVSIDLTEYTDGAPHLIEFHSITGQNGNTTNFFVDDVELIVTSVAAIPTINEWGILILSLFLVVAGIIVMRRFSSSVRHA
jgi:hypothetical protein